MKKITYYDNENNNEDYDLVGVANYSVNGQAIPSFAFLKVSKDEDEENNNKNF
jgi:hypothetical protein